MDQEKAYTRDRQRAAQIVLDALGAVRAEKGETFRQSVDQLASYIAVPTGETAPSRATLYRVISNWQRQPPEGLTVTRSGSRGNYVFSFVGETVLAGERPSQRPRSTGAPLTTKIERLIASNKELDEENKALRRKVHALTLSNQALESRLGEMQEAERLLASV